MSRAEWLPLDQLEAMSMGWFVAVNEGRLEIQRHDEAPLSLRFESDAAALEWVTLAANLGNDLEIRALAHVGVQS